MAKKVPGKWPNHRIIFAVPLSLSKRTLTFEHVSLLDHSGDGRAKPSRNIMGTNRVQGVFSEKVELLHNYEKFSPIFCKN